MSSIFSSRASGWASLFALTAASSLTFVVSGCGDTAGGGADAVDSAATGGDGSGTGGAAVGTGGGTPGVGGTDAGTGGGGGVDKPATRVVGYLPTYRDMNPANYDFATMTHLCIAFANPTGNGSESDFANTTPTAVQGLIDAAHAQGVKVLASIAGAAGGGPVEAQIAPGTVDAYVAGLVHLMTRYGLDGIDVDIEGEHVKPVTYEPFVKKLHAALPAEALLTVAVANWNGDDFPDGALAEYDFINIMSYDHCGPWNPGCEHSSLAGTNEDVAYWANDRGIPRDKLVIGVPFYGYCFGSACESEAYTYADLVSRYPEAKTTDWIEKPNMTFTLNSATTIATKAELAKTYGGVMIWELGQDATGDDSLFKVIADAQ